MKRCFSGVMAVLLMAVACQTEKIETYPEYGTLDITLAGEPSLDVEVKSSQTLSAAEAAEYSVTIYDASDAVVYGPVKYKDFTPQILPMGTYYVSAENCSLADAEANNGKMRLAGRSQDIVLSASAISQTAEVECVVTNAKVSFVFDPSLTGMFDDLVLKFKRPGIPGTNNVRTDAEYWCNPSTVTYTISGIFKQTGRYLELTRELTLAAKDNVKVVIKLNLANGELAATIIVVDDLNPEKTEEVDFNPYA